MPQLAAVTFQCDEEPVVRVRELPFDDRVEVLVTFPQQHRAIVLFGDGASIVAGLRCLADDVERSLTTDATEVEIDLVTPPASPAEPTPA